LTRKRTNNKIPRFEIQFKPGRSGTKEREMGKMARIAATLLLVTALAFTVLGCSKQAGPKDEDVIKAVTSTVESSAKGYTLKSPVVILERGKQAPSGDWPIKVEYTVGLQDGSTKKEVTTYNFSASVDAMGANTWLASEAK
jgi:hypothetical protein